MQGEINLDLWFCLSNNGFSLDELVHTLKRNYEEKAFSDLLRLILLLVQEVLVDQGRAAVEMGCAAMRI